MSIRNLQKFLSFNSDSELEATNVVIVGGGYGGVAAAKALTKKKVKVTIVAQEPYFFYTVRGLEQCVEDKQSKFMPRLDRLVPSANIVVGRAVDWDLHNQVLNVFRTGEEAVTTLNFDYLIVATGVQSQFPARPKALSSEKVARQDYAELRQLIKRSPSVMVIGGGPTGVELIGEISAVYPSANLPRQSKLPRAKKLTLVHNGPYLLSSPGVEAVHEANERKLGGKVQSALQSRGCSIIVDDTLQLRLPGDGSGIIHSPGAVYTTEAGKEIQADLVIFAYGRDPNEISFLDSLRASAKIKEEGDNKCAECQVENVTDERSLFKVLPSLRLQGDCNGCVPVFAIGDCTNIAEPKQGHRAMEQAKVVARNIVKLAKGLKGDELEEYVPAPPTMIVPLGGNTQFMLARNAVRRVPGLIRKIVDMRVLG